MWRVLLSLTCVLLVGASIALAQESRGAKPGPPGATDEGAIATAHKERVPRREDAPPHKQRVYHLENAPAQDVTKTLNELLRSLRVIGQLPNEIILVPESITNSVVISAAAEDFDKVIELIRQLDQRPLSVKVELLIVEVHQPDGKKTPLRESSTRRPAPRANADSPRDPNPGRSKQGADRRPSSSSPRLPERLRVLRGCF